MTPQPASSDKASAYQAAANSLAWSTARLSAGGRKRVTFASRSKSSNVASVSRMNASRRSDDFKWHVRRWLRTKTPMSTSSGEGAGNAAPLPADTCFRSMGSPDLVDVSPDGAACHSPAEKACPEIHQSARIAFAHAQRHVSQIVGESNDCKRSQAHLSGS